MLSSEVVKKIALLFNGDEYDIFPVKKGYELVEFFNENFGYNDEYGRGFPSKWYYTKSKIEELIEICKFDEFLNIILDTKYICKLLQIGRVESVAIIEDIKNILNKLLYNDGYEIIMKNKRYSLCSINDDLEEIGHGGFADVYYQKSTNRVIKKLNDDSIREESLRSRFKREFEIMKSIRDLENILNVYEFNEYEYSYSMEYADNTLFELIKENSINEEDKLEYIKTILSTMELVHERNIIHRDLSPNNILMVNGVLKISDFGLGKDIKKMNSHMTILTNNYGQFDYCSPEQREGLAQADERSDVFSLGKIINFILTGNPNLDNHFLKALTRKAINLNPEDRYINAGDFNKAVIKLIENYKKRSNKEIIYSKINESILDEEVMQYLYNIEKNELLRAVRDNKKFVNVLYKFIEDDYENGTIIIDIISKNYIDICTKYEHNDNFAQLTYLIIKGTAEFEIKKIAAEILQYIAFDVNRFKAQNLIKSLIQRGIEPELERILTHN